MSEFLLPAILNLFDPLNIFLMIAGLAGGIIVGALPGLTATMGVALMVPVTFAMNPVNGLIMLGAIYCGAIYGGANSAILICTPGTPSSVATTFDGWPLCQAGARTRRCILPCCLPLSAVLWEAFSCSSSPLPWPVSPSSSAARKTSGSVCSACPPSR